MTKRPTTLDDLFNEVEEERANQPAPKPTDPKELARRMEEHQRLLDEAGPEPDDDTDDEED